MGDKLELIRYFNELDVRLSAIEHVKKQIASVLAPDFTLFSILRPDEVRLSNLIAQILNPNGAHGQSFVYLDLFLDHLKESIKSKMSDANTQIIDTIQREWKKSSTIRTVLEQCTNLISESQRRVDILIDGNGYGLMIENKPSAADQKGQLSDYAKYLDLRYGGNYIMVYLSGTGEKPSANSLSDDEQIKYEKSGNYICIDYYSFLSNWLRDCIKATEPDRVRWILKDFIKFIENKFKQQHVADEEFI